MAGANASIKLHSWSVIQSKPAGNLNSFVQIQRTNGSPLRLSRETLRTSQLSFTKSENFQQYPTPLK
ncbi:hypothetical protein RHMOL_Rhmol13G0126900 [Rhododendron molle]|uniref:Uncharacterized protein n=1 Tax=Rhododendron molle TaxID=49168 RepID=A0ACC0L606_RHOML|nr:hypothetical protein RHMOL_Rhmol13G0126900 [Rhododendron molle]